MHLAMARIESVSATTEEMMLKRDRSFTVVTDALDENETKGVLGSATMLARQIREVVIPEVEHLHIRCGCVPRPATTRSG